MIIYFFKNISKRESFLRKIQFENELFTFDILTQKAKRVKLIISSSLYN
jgi:hypothetical protein